MKKTTAWLRRRERGDANTDIRHQGGTENRTQVTHMKVITNQEGRERKSRGGGEL